MSFAVYILPSAERELNEAYDWLATQTENAAQWYNSMLEAILSLSDMPSRHPLARDRTHHDGETRQLAHGSGRHAYLIYFVIRGDRVMVTHLRHGSRER